MAVRPSAPRASSPASSPAASPPGVAHDGKDKTKYREVQTKLRELQIKRREAQATPEAVVRRGSVTDSDKPNGDSPFLSDLPDGSNPAPTVPSVVKMEVMSPAMRISKTSCSQRVQDGS
jgi:hypothetical protein